LQSEEAFDRGTRNRRAWNLQDNGATKAEIDFLLDQRVELNAMTSDQLVAFVERKLKKHGIKKIVPDKGELQEAYRLFAHSQKVETIIERELKKLDCGEAQVPRDIEKRVRQHLARHPTVRWDEAIAEIAEEAEE
jgi:hypothetical protein